MAIAKTWVFAELLDGKPVPAVLELLTKARSLGGTVEAVAFGPDAEAAAAVLGDYGATTLHAGTDAAYGELLPGGPVGDAIATLVGEHHPDLILIASTYAGRRRRRGRGRRGAGGGAGCGLRPAAPNPPPPGGGEKKPALALIRPKSFVA